MYRVDRNNFYKREKPATVYTPTATSDFLFSIISPHITKGLVLDPCVGQGSLLMPFMNAGYEVLGIDVEEQGFSGAFLRQNYLEMEKGQIPEPNLVIMNPPFNIDRKTKDYIKLHYSGRPLLPEVWFMKAIELFGRDIPIVMFTPYGFRLNLTEKSKRWAQFINGVYPEIASIISLPKNLFENILFHSEVVVFNIHGMKGHYFHGNHGQMISA